MWKLNPSLLSDPKFCNILGDSIQNYWSVNKNSPVCYNLGISYFLYCWSFQDGAEDGSRVASSEKTLQVFVCFLLLLLLFYVLDVVSITVYDRDTLLNIGSSVVQRKPEFEFLNAGGLFTDTASEPFVWNARPR